MPTYKLTYFNGKARGETPRFLFAIAGVKYEDDRFEFAEWPARKPTTPFGTVPVLEVDGVTISQSTAICRYLAKQFGYDGKSNFESGQCDMIAYSVEDATEPGAKYFFEQDEAKKAELKQKFEKEQLPESMSKLEKLLCGNKGGDGYFVGDGLTWADMHFANMSDLWESFGAKICWDNFPKLSKLKTRVKSQAKIAEWLAKRPATSL